MSIKVLWVVPNLTQENKQTSSHIASVRLRCLEIIRCFNGTQNHPEIQSQVISCQTSIELLNTARIYNPDLIIFGKLFAPLSPAILQLHNEGKRIALDICDDIFELAHLHQRYEPLLLTGLAWISASTFIYEKLMSKRAQGFLAGTLFKVEDPPEGLPSKTTRPTHAELGRCEFTPIELVWFGNYPNLEPLCGFIDNNQYFHFTIVVITQLDARTQKKLASKMSSRFHRLHLVQWSLEAQRHAIMNAHASIIPCGQNPSACAKTANRLITSLWFGTPVIASPIPSYLPFSQYTFLDENLNEATQRLVSTPWDSIEQMVLNGQRAIEKTTGLDVISAQWHKTICKLTNQAQGSQFKNRGTVQ